MARKLSFSKSNAMWLAITVAVGLITFFAFGWQVCLISVIVVLAISEIVERRARSKRLQS